MRFLYLIFQKVLSYKNFKAGMKQSGEKLAKDDSRKKDNLDRFLLDKQLSTAEEGWTAATSNDEQNDDDVVEDESEEDEFALASPISSSDEIEVSDLNHSYLS